MAVAISSPPREHADALIGPPGTLRIEQWSAWGLVALYVAYAACVAASGVARYALVFPIVCVLIGFIFKRAADQGKG